MNARCAFVVALAAAIGWAAVPIGEAQGEEFPDEVSASKCKRKKKIFGFIGDATGTPAPHRIKIPSTFYIEQGSIYLQGCKSFPGDSDGCQETFGLGLLLSPGFTGEMPCNSQSGLPYITYGTSSADGTENVYWSNTTNCTVTVTKNDEERGRLKGMYRSEMVNLSGPTPVYADLVGCFSARRQ